MLLEREKEKKWHSEKKGNNQGGKTSSDGRKEKAQRSKFLHTILNKRWLSFLYWSYQMVNSCTTWFISNSKRSCLKLLQRLRLLSWRNGRRKCRNGKRVNMLSNPLLLRLIQKWLNWEQLEVGFMFFFQIIIFWKDCIFICLFFFTSIL